MTRVGGRVRFLAAVTGRELTPFHGAEGPGALQQIGKQWPSGPGNDDRWRLGGLRALAAVAGRKSTPFHGAEGPGALQDVGQQWPSGLGNDDPWRAAVPRSRGWP